MAPLQAAPAEASLAAACRAPVQHRLPRLCAGRSVPSRGRAPPARPASASAALFSLLCCSVGARVLRVLRRRPQRIL